MDILFLIFSVFVSLIGAFLFFGGLAFFLLEDEVKWKMIGLIPVVIGVVLLVLTVAEIHSQATDDGQSEYQGTAITSLETGEKHEVISIGENETKGETYLLLSPLGENEVFFYETRTERIPDNLEVNDVIMRTKKQGIVIVNT